MAEIERGWAEFIAVIRPRDLDADSRAALELAYHAGASHALALVGRSIQDGATAATLGPVLLAWAHEIVTRSNRIAQDVLGEEASKGATGC